jgi:hypothetical protein
MSKKLIVSLLVVGLLLLSVPMALAANDKLQNPEIAKLQQQIHDMQKQLIQKYVDNGKFTSEQGKSIQERMDKGFQNAQENGFQPGAGCASGGSGLSNGGCCGGLGGPVNGATPQSNSNL